MLFKFKDNYSNLFGCPNFCIFTVDFSLFLYVGDFNIRKSVIETKNRTLIHILATKIKIKMTFTTLKNILKIVSLQSVRQ